MTELLARFLAAFQRGIEGELAAIQRSSELLEVPLGRGEELGPRRYAFEVRAGERLAAETVCLLRGPRGEQRVSIERVDAGRVTIAAAQPVDLDGPNVLFASPAFLYERLVQALATITEAPLGLALFGKLPATRTPSALLREHGALNESQRAAVQLCAESSLAFVWGPPGTGKTATLVHVIDELVARGERILLASTTNAAIDQVLAKLSTHPCFAAGTFVRLGRSDADTFGTELADVVAARQGEGRGALVRLRQRLGAVEQEMRFVQALIADLAPALTTQQSLFAAATPPLRASALERVFTAADAIAALDARAQLRVLEQRLARLERVRVLAKAQAAARVAEARDLEQRVIAEARVILCTLTAAYLSPHLTGQRFDVLIAEEAGMATLPPLFYAASLCDRRAVVVGDPRQLPPIVQSDDELVRRTLGRNVFDVTVPDPERSAVVAMLEVQYRMHPRIGALVGELFYGGRLTHAAAGTEALAAREPFAGRAVVVCDTRSTCERSQKGSSRVNATSAEVTAELALAAVRGGSTSIAVITPYAAQAAEIRRLLAARRIGEAVECSTIHRFQGRECDVVILDLVDAEPMRPSALLAEAPNLLNVSISRARGKLVIVADVAYFAARDPGGQVARLLRQAAAP